MKWQEVKDLFRDNVGDVSYVELFNDENEKPRGCGILEFASEDLAKNAVDKMHRYEYKGRKLVVKEDFETERDKYGRIISSKGNEFTSAIFLIKSQYSKSQIFVQKFNFDKTQTISRVFPTIFFGNFSREIKVVNS